MSDRLESRFGETGFAVIEDLIAPEALEALRAGYDALLAADAGAEAGDRYLGGLTRQIMSPERLHPVFADNPALRAAAPLAQRLTGSEGAQMTFSMLIYKPPGHLFETPWHQDLAYAALPTAPAGVTIPFNVVVQFWMALDDVDETMGCMEFAPGRHREPMAEHHVASGEPTDAGRLLAIKAPEQALDLQAVVKAPLRAGSATVHGYTTPHRTGPNVSPRQRRAYIFSFADPARLAAAAAEVARHVHERRPA